MKNKLIVPEIIVPAAVVDRRIFRGPWSGGLTDNLSVTDKKIGVLAMPLLALVLASCGGSGSSNDNDNATRYNAVARGYGDSWTMSTTQTSYDGTTTTLIVEKRVNAVNADGSFSLTVVDDLSNTIRSIMHAPDGMRTVSQGCIFMPEEISFPFPMYVGKTWTSSYAKNCVNQDQVAVTGVVTGEKTATISAGSFHVLEVSFQTAQIGDIADPSTAQHTCLWSTDLGISIQCTIASSYTHPVGDSVVTDSTELQSYTKGMSGGPPVAPSSIYPAFHPAVPQVGPLVTGASLTVIAAPTLVPLYFANTENQIIYTSFISKFAASTAWTPLTEFGVGPALVAAPLILTSAAPPATTDQEINTWLINQAPGFGSIDANALLVLLYPMSTVISLTSAVTGINGTMCQPGGLDSYHNHVMLDSGIDLPYAVIPDCAGGFGQITSASSHEIVEGVTDPLSSGYNTVTGDVSWSRSFAGAELADMCQSRSDRLSYPADIGYTISRIWSNSSGLSFADPCGAATSYLHDALYFNSAPVLPDTVNLNLGIYGTGPAKGVVIAAGASQTIDVQLFSNGPTNGIWNVVAEQVGVNDSGTNVLQFSWDKTNGQNGDVLKLTITAPDAPLANGAVFKIHSYYGGIVTNWTGAVANSAIF